MNTKLKKCKIIIALLLSLLVITTVVGCEEADQDYKKSSFNATEGLNSNNTQPINTEETQPETQNVAAPAPQPSNVPQKTTISLSEIPTYSGSPFVAINNNTPLFTAEEKQRTDAFEAYSELDSRGRCGVAFASVCKEIMPTEKRGEIGNIKPSGWNQNKYPGLVDGNYLYNRCHLIGFQLAGENDNPKNLITGTRYLNVNGMLPFENMIDDYVDETNHHVLYRVTPMFCGDNLLANGVLMEAWSVEDNGAGICFNVFCYNVQPGVYIDFTNGSNYQVSQVQSQAQQSPAPQPQQSQPQQSQNQGNMVWIPKSGKKYHSNPSCSNMSNPSQVTESEAQSRGYDRCKKCW